VKFDGLSHFLTCRFPVGATLMKRRHLELLGYTSSVCPSGNGADGERRKEEVSKGQTAHFMILNYSSKKWQLTGEALHAQ
jgi:hypothetical protein